MHIPSTRIAAAVVSLSLATSVGAGSAPGYAKTPTHQAATKKAAARLAADQQTCTTLPAKEALLKAQATQKSAATAVTSAQTSVTQDKNAVDSAASAQAAAQSSYDAATTALANAKAALAAAQQKVTASKTTLNTAIKNKRPQATITKYRQQVTAAQNAAGNAQTALTSAQNALNAALTNLNTAKSTSASTALTYANATSALATATAALANANAGLATATTAFDDRPVVFVTQNLDWATGSRADGTQLAHLCALGADYTMVQEAKNIKLANLLMPVEGTNQNTANESVAGAAIIWRKPDALDPVGHVGPMTGHGMYLGVNASALHIEMLDRYVTWVDTTVDGVHTRVISLHFPPKRFSSTWGTETKALKHVIDARPKGYEWIVGSDFNQPPADVAKNIGGTAYGQGIDGFIVSGGLKVLDMKVDTYGMQIKETDHPGIRIEVVRR